MVIAMPCIISDDDCVPGRLRKKLCERHYRRMLHTGTTERRAYIDNFSRYTILPNGCWHWDGPLWPNGYGKPSTALHGTTLAHRAFYIEHVGPIPERLDLDHTCHNADVNCLGGNACPHRACVNPEHLEPATRSLNLRRGHDRRTHCESGLHDLTLPGSTKPGTAVCIECWRIRYRKSGAKYRALRKRW